MDKQGFLLCQGNTRKEVRAGTPEARKEPCFGRSAAGAGVGPGKVEGIFKYKTYKALSVSKCSKGFRMGVFLMGKMPKQNKQKQMGRVRDQRITKGALILSTGSRTKPTQT